MKTALLVIDMQNDYLWEKRKKRFSYNTEKVVASVNELIRQYHNENRDVIYIRHIIQNFFTNRLLFGYSIAGSEGAELYSGLDIVSDHCFDKYFSDAFSSRKFKEFVCAGGYETLHLCGLDECGCVAATALGALKRGLNAAILREGTVTRFPENKVNAIRKRLNSAGIQYIDTVRK